MTSLSHCETKMVIIQICIVGQGKYWKRALFLGPGQLLELLPWDFKLWRSSTQRESQPGAISPSSG